MKTVFISGGLALALVVTSLGTNSEPEPFYDGLGSYTRKITTNSEEAQKYFNQGLNFLYGFNHGAAIRSFQAAEADDPEGRYVCKSAG